MRPLTDWAGEAALRAGGLSNLTTRPLPMTFGVDSWGLFLDMAAVRTNVAALSGATLEPDPATGRARLTATALCAWGREGPSP